MEENIRILILEDNPAYFVLLENELRQAGISFSIEHAENKEGFVLALKQFNPQLILSNYSLPGFDGLEALAIAKSECPEVPFIFVFGATGEEFAIETLKKGAVDYVLKNNLARLGSVVQRALQEGEHLSARKRAEKNFRDMVEASPCAMILTNKDQEIIFTNKAAQQVFGYSPQELLKMHVGDLIPRQYREDHREQAKNYYHDLKSRSMGHERTLAGLRKDGTEIPMEIGLNPIRTQAGDQVLVSIKDVTDRKRYEDQLKKQAALGQFAGSIGHEFRNQLGVMRNAAYFIKMKLADEEDRKIVKHLNMLEEEIISADKTIKNILNFAKEDKLDAQEVDINELLSESVKACKAGSRIKVKIQKEGKLPAILADPIQLKSVFTNIILNALEAIKEKGSLSIKAVREKDYIYIHFKDNGCGIKPEDKDSIFVPLFTTKARGIGLGLVTCKKIIENHDGTIAIESQAGQGTTVIVKLPIRPHQERVQ